MANITNTRINNYDEFILSNSSSLTPQIPFKSTSHALVSALPVKDFKNPNSLEDGKTFNNEVSVEDLCARSAKTIDASSVRAIKKFDIFLDKYNRYLAEKDSQLEGVNVNDKLVEKINTATSKCDNLLIENVVGKENQIKNLKTGCKLKSKFNNKDRLMQLMQRMDHLEQDRAILKQDTAASKQSLDHVQQGNSILKQDINAVSNQCMIDHLEQETDFLKRDMARLKADSLVLKREQNTLFICHYYDAVAEILIIFVYIFSFLFIIFFKLFIIVGAKIFVPTIYLNYSRVIWLN